MTDKPIPLTPVQAILAERNRQQVDEGFTADHDAQHTPAQLALGAAAYALMAGGRGNGGRSYWPWPDGFKEKDQYRALVCSGAMILAALDEMQREAEKALTASSSF